MLTTNKMILDHILRRWTAEACLLGSNARIDRSDAVYVLNVTCLTF